MITVSNTFVHRSISVVQKSTVKSKKKTGGILRPLRVSKTIAPHRETQRILAVSLIPCQDGYSSLGKSSQSQPLHIAICAKERCTSPCEHYEEPVWRASRAINSEQESVVNRLRLKIRFSFPAPSSDSCDLRAISCHACQRSNFFVVCT